MRDLVARLKQALPAAVDWVAQLEVIYRPQSFTPADAGPARLAEYYPAALLERARFVLLDTLPFPPVSELGLPEFEAMAAMPKAGIAFGSTYFLARAHASEGTHFHELVHVVQWAELGLAGFLEAYAISIVQHGYDGSAFEMMASRLQARYERGEPIPDAVDIIRAHALETASRTRRIVEAHGARQGGERGDERR
ncbi:MAG: hypothetical protein U0527_01060 [Candidatus Eisenbacteria bacterium]